MTYVHLTINTLCGYQCFGAALIRWYSDGTNMGDLYNNPVYGKMSVEKYSCLYVWCTKYTLHTQITRYLNMHINTERTFLQNRLTSYFVCQILSHLLH